MNSFILFVIVVSKKQANQPSEQFNVQVAAGAARSGHRRFSTFYTMNHDERPDLLNYFTHPCDK